MQAWKNYPRTGLKAMDDEHGGISDGLERTLDALHAGQRADTVRELGEVARLVAEHFAHEERLMKASGYPDLKRHADAHRLFVADLRASQVELAKNGVSEKFRRWLTGRALDWFRFHIVTHDVSLGHFLHREAQTEAALASAGPAAPVENRKPS